MSTKPIDKAYLVESFKNFKTAKVDPELDKKVDKVVGSSLITSGDLNQITTNKDNITTLNADVQTAGSVKYMIKAETDKITSFEQEIVSALPTTGVKGKIYLVPNGSSGSNLYDEYIWVGAAFDRLGSAEVDLSGYVQKETGKGLSTNNYDDIEKGEVAKIKDKVDKVDGKGLSTVDFTDTLYVHTDNNYTAADKAEVAKVAGKADKATTLAGYGITDALASSLKGAVNGIAELDTDGKVPASQLPSYVDDVLEYTAKSAFPATGETGKIYIDISTNITYRWSGSVYVPIGSDLALGETSSTAYAGDKGKKVTEDLATHKNDTTAHITAAERQAWNAKTSNVGTITGIKMNGVSKGTSGVVDLGNVVTNVADFIWTGTQAEYDAIATKNPSVIYLIHS